jgi:hypothetical protein
MRNRLLIQGSVVIIGQVLVTVAAFYLCSQLLARKPPLWLTSFFSTLGFFGLLMLTNWWFGKWK